MSARLPPSELHARLLKWMCDERSGFASFDEAAAAVFRHQYENNAPYRRYWDSLGIALPQDDFDWRTVPTLPTDCFKETAFPPRSFPAEETRHVFLTSGTTKEIRGRHEFATLALYETSIREGWKQLTWPVPPASDLRSHENACSGVSMSAEAHEKAMFVPSFSAHRQLDLPTITSPWFLAPPASSTPDSSLAHMFATLGAGFDNRWLMDENGTLDLSPLTANTAPAGLFSTSIALFRLMENHPPLALPEGSWIFETGGPKGLSITLDPTEFHHRIAAHFSIPRDRVLNEYSMTELSSQFYRWSGETSHRGPHWTRIRVIDPETNRPAADGQPGYLEIIDLANLGSVAAIRTQDLAIAIGENAFQLLGRDPAALPRGCSRAADDLWQRQLSTD